jgi:hypothetical protein
VEPFLDQHPKISFVFQRHLKIRQVFTGFEAFQFTEMYLKEQHSCETYLSRFSKKPIVQIMNL